MVGVQRCTREVFHAGDFSPPLCGGCRRQLRLTMVGSSGALTNVIQVFSTLDIRVERLQYVQNERSDGHATLSACFAADDRTVDLLYRKLTRLIEVLSVDDIKSDTPSCDQTDEVP